MNENDLPPGTTINYPDNLGTPTTSQLHPSTTAFLLDYDKDIDDFIHRLSGEEPVYDAKEDTITWKKPEKNDKNEYVVGREPTLNNEGCYATHRFLKNLASKIVTISQVDDKQWRDDLLSITLIFSEHLFLNYRRYGLKPKNFAQLDNEITTMVEFILSKNKKGTSLIVETIHPRWTSQEHVFIQKNAENQNKGKLGFLGL